MSVLYEKAMGFSHFPEYPVIAPYIPDYRPKLVRTIAEKYWTDAESTLRKFGDKAVAEYIFCPNFSYLFEVEHKGSYIERRTYHDADLVSVLLKVV